MSDYKKLLNTLHKYKKYQEGGTVEYIDDTFRSALKVQQLGLHDGYLLRSYNNLPLSNDTSVDEISWQLNDPSASVFSSDALPTTAPVLEDWQSIYGLRLHGERGEYIIDATVTSAIPEPATLLLFGWGILLAKS